MSIEHAFLTVVGVVFAAGVFTGALVAWAVHWWRRGRRPVLVVTITPSTGGGYLWEAAIDMGKAFDEGVADSWHGARLRGLHAFDVDIDV